MTGLPDNFKKKMEQLLGEEYEAFIESYEKERAQGLRMNLLKISREEGDRLLEEFRLSPVPWTEEGRYYSQETRPGKHPFHEAGLYYIQEPSAMAVISLLNPCPGERVLDLCAAPGGKTSHIASRLRGRGFLLSNEIHPARARILSQNVERMGIGNAVVSNEDSASLVSRFPEFFDRIAVDAPCSGEGMFRKDETAREEWSPDNVKLCAARQDEILSNAALMLKKGGTLVYSTCTFSPEEDEQSIERFLANHPDFVIADCHELVMSCGYTGLSEGRPQWGKTASEELKKTFRIWPHCAEGEGHYIAVLKKEGKCLTADSEGLREEKGGSKTESRKKGKTESAGPYIRDKKLLKDIEDFLLEVCPGADSLRGKKEWLLFGEQLYLVPEEMPDIKGMKVVRPGLHAAVLKKNRLEPAHGLAMWLKKEQAALTYELDYEEAEQYLKGETIAGEGKKGWTLMCLEGFPLGWAKEAGGILKNHYPKGLRIQK